MSSQPHRAPRLALDIPSLVHPVTPGPELLETAAGSLRMLAEPTRLHLPWQLEQGPQNVTELTTAAGVPRTVVSQHPPNSASAGSLTRAKTADTSSTPSMMGTSYGSSAKPSTTPTTGSQVNPPTAEQITPPEVLARRAAPPQAVGPWQFMRAGVVTGLAAAAAAAAHQSADGHLPPAALMTLPAALVMAPVTVLSRSKLSISVLAGILAIGQGFVPVAFNALSAAGPHCGSAGIAAHSHHQEVAFPDCAAAPAAVTDAATSGVGPTTITAAHVLATVLKVLVLSRAEAALWQLRDWLRPLTQPLRAAVLPRGVNLPAPAPVSRPWLAPGTRMTAPRGPPRPDFLLPVH